MSHKTENHAGSQDWMSKAAKGTEYVEEGKGKFIQL
jgi:hypothetical protein